MDMLYYYISLQKLYAKHWELIQFLLDIQTDFKEKKIVFLIAFLIAYPRY